MEKVAILLTVFNRKVKTLECLKNCYQQIDAMKADVNYSFCTNVYRYSKLSP